MHVGHMVRMSAYGDDEDGDDDGDDDKDDNNNSKINNIIINPNDGHF